jgi:RNA polymerase sigma-70 factor (ECF subfamily)
MQPTDRDLLASLRDGDEGAFEVLYRRHKDRLYRHALVQTGGRTAIAEEIVQDVFLSMFTRDIEPAHSVAGYLLAMTRNRALNAVQRRESKADHLGDAAALLASCGESPAGEANRNEEAKLLAQALLGLSPEQREVVLLRTYEGLSWKDVATLVGAPVPTVSTRYRAALQRLRTTCRSLSHA